jgi:hypothetical protein
VSETPLPGIKLHTQEGDWETNIIVLEF